MVVPATAPMAWAQHVQQQRTLFSIGRRAVLMFWRTSLWWWASNTLCRDSKLASIPCSASRIMAVLGQLAIPASLSHVHTPPRHVVPGLARRHPCIPELPHRRPLMTERTPGARVPALAQTGTNTVTHAVHHMADNASSPSPSRSRAWDCSKGQQSV